MPASSQYCHLGVPAPANPTIERTNSILGNQGKNPLDPTERLPPELSVRCIQDALFASRAYTSKILELTSVSKGWQKFLLSACVLWAEIHIHWLEQDLLATIAIFIHNSDSVPLFVTIWDHPGSKWQEVEQLLVPHATRIRRVNFKGIYSTVPNAPATTGRGGYGNVVNRSRSRSGDPATTGKSTAPPVHTYGHGGAGNVAYSSGAHGEGHLKSVEEDEARAYQKSGERHVHSSGRGGAVNISSTAVPSRKSEAQEMHDHHHHAEGVASIRRGGAGNFKATEEV